MKKSILFASICLSVNLFAQNITITNGSQFKVTSLETIENTLHISRSHSSFLTNAGLFGQKFRVLNLDKNLDLKSKHEIEIPKMGRKKVKYFKSFTSGDDVYFLSTRFDRKTDSYIIYASELNISNGKFNKHFEALKVTDDKFRSGYMPFNAVESVDSTKVLIVTEYPTKNREKARYGLTVLNNDMSTLWSKDIEFPEQDKYFSLMDIEVDKDGNIHFVARIRMTGKEKRAKDAKSRYYAKIYSYYHEDNELKQHEISFKDLIISELDLDVNERNELIGKGFYSDKHLVSGYKGFFFLKIDPKTREVSANNISAFSPDLIKELYSRKKQGERKAKKGKFPPYKIRASIALENGGYAVVAEHYVYTKRTSTSSNGQQTTTETWLFGNVVVMYLDSEGKMITASVIKKKQFCTAKNGGASYFQLLGIGLSPGVNELPYYGISVIQNNSNIYLLYNENPKNDLRVKEGKTPKSVRQRTSVTMLATFTPDGTINSDVLFKSKDRKAGIIMPLMPRSYVQYSKNETIVFGRKGKKMRATRISIK